MASNASRRAHERRLRASYRRKVVMVGIIMLIIGLAGGYMLCMLTTETPQATADPSVTTTPMAAMSTPEPTALELVPTAEVTQSPAEVAAQSTEQATEAPTQAPTEAPTQAPTEAPTQAPTEAPTQAPTTAPTAAVQNANAPATANLEGLAAQPETEATVQAAAEATAQPTAEPTEAPAPQPIIVPFGQAQTFTTEILPDGTARLNKDDANFETLNFTLKVDAYKDQAYFEKNYADKYALQGTEAAVEFDLTLNGYTGETTIVPQNVILITFCGEDPNVVTQGYQLMDFEIGGKNEIAIESDTPTTLYKRYPYDKNQGDMKYMVVEAFNDGVESIYWFEIADPNADAKAAETETTGTDAKETDENKDSETAAEGEELKIGSSGDAVKKLQSKLISMGLLSGSPDGKFGNYTAEAVKQVQKKFDMEQTGVADAAFLEKLYE